ncbi:Transcriptional regulator, LacI family (plasmid) [Sinorhizobium sojae CCBAU 05684]|uniref:Transcriptional regulator, LacI family n=1 Tax=Sinorhizobium sojae CCBAU 05684 TaxID=716928 RepID=A0A249PI99_9HYPH|nr:LacI family DNA-binding transcriptional regulator [Sinorhizobium sojae]ASY65663.1 Transcriptional regulator, LacI family [Sinorhizobium sojae CCBAU 05684]
MAAKKPSIREVAAYAGVSTATVSNVFSGRKPVNEELKKSVLEAAQHLGYHIDRAASQLRSGRTRIIAVLVPDLTDTFFATIVSRLETQAFAEGYDVIVASSHDDPSVESSRLKALLSWRPAGLIAVPCSSSTPAELIEIEKRLPMVLVDRVASEGAIADTVTIDNREAGQIAAGHLLEHGHRDIVIAVSNLDFPPIFERAEGAADLIAQRTGARPVTLKLGSNMELGARTFSDWMDRNAAPGAVIALTNITTLSVLSALAERRIAIPEKTSIVAFDDYAWMAARNTGLTAIRQPVDRIAETAWKRLQLRMDNGMEAPAEPSVLNASLVERDSVRDLDSRKPHAVGNDAQDTGLSGERILAASGQGKNVH